MASDDVKTKFIGSQPQTRRKGRMQGRKVDGPFQVKQAQIIGGPEPGRISRTPRVAASSGIRTRSGARNRTEGKPDPGPLPFAFA